MLKILDWFNLATRKDNAWSVCWMELLWESDRTFLNASEFWTENIFEMYLQNIHQFVVLLCRYTVSKVDLKEMFFFI